MGRGRASAGGLPREVDPAAQANEAADLLAQAADLLRALGCDLTPAKGGVMAKARKLPLIENFTQIPDEALVPPEEQPYPIPEHWKWVRLWRFCG